MLMTVSAAAVAAPDLETIMQDPDWIGPPVEQAWWQLDGSAYFYRVKRSGSDIRDTWRVDLDDGETSRLAAKAESETDAADPVFDALRSRALSVRENSLFLRDLGNNALTRLFTGTDTISNIGFSADQQHVQFESDGRWWRIALAGGAAVPVAELRFEDAPHAAPEDDLEADQLRLFSTLERMRQRRQEQYEQDLQDARADAGRVPVPWYLGKGHSASSTSLSPDARWVLVVVENADADEGESDNMPRFVTRSGYVEIEDVRTLVGRKPPSPQSLWLLDLETRKRHEIELDSLAGRDVDPLAELKQARDIDPHGPDDLRPVQVSGIEWHSEDSRALVQVRAIDNKDRWTVVVNATDQSTKEIHRLTDPAWINWAFNEFGWVPGSESAWLQSEQDGYAHLYMIDADGRQRQQTRGEFEVYDIEFAADGESALMISNAEHPTRYDLYRLDIASGRMDKLTDLDGLEGYATLPDSDRILVRYSGSYLPPQAAVLDGASGKLAAASDTLTDEYKAIEWQQPEFAGVPSSHVERPIWTKFYPARGDFQGPRPVVVFVHGAGYTQNTHHRFPYYFREQMFHNLLTERGYHVIDMDYRASRGYGRDWRTAIYRQMGTPELEDLVDGVAWLVENHDADPARVGVYGGSYGGFMTFMAMFNAPEVFAAGASLRPVTDWAHYNHGYTSNILNTPEVDPEAYRRSSPIEFVEGLQGDLLISHGMLDDNVFYKDSVRLAQRLIELEKQDWELASYPLEPHGYEHPESWLDQYRRILKLFENSLGHDK
ncbi:MAG: S9 family peptidase [Xanthomonadales bacterium]|nr:S9 family peptidase [Xanthomonadales bacterium]